MMVDRVQPGQTSLSIDGETIAFTMQAEVEDITLEQLAACALSDMADEPGMVRFPVTIEVMIPDDLLSPAGPAAQAEADHDDPVPPEAGRGRPRTRFGN